MSGKIVKYLHDFIVCDSKAMQIIYKEKFETKTVYISYGAFIESENKIKKNTSSFDSYFLLVGRIVPDNNIDFIINAFIKSSVKRKLLVVGGTNYEDKYYHNSMSHLDDRIEYLGYIKNEKTLLDLYRNAYCYIHGHEFGGTNPSLLNALGTGVPVLALNTVFNSEVLFDGKYGLLFEKNGFKSVIENLDSKYEKVAFFRNIAIEHIENNYSWHGVYEKYKLLFNMIEKKND